MDQRHNQKEKSMLRKLSFAITVLIGLVTAAVAQTGSIQVDNPWARASVGKTGAIYLTIKNTGGTDDRLVSAATPAADQAQLHIEINDNGVMKMRPLSAIDVKANSTVTLAPGGMHVMLVGLKQPLKEGQSFPLTLTFAKAGQIDATVMVMKAGAMNGMAM
jgi:periplasmic copper chaperone A